MPKLNTQLTTTDTGSLPTIDKVAGLFTDEIRIMMATLKMSKLGGLSVAECESPELQTQLFEYFRQRLAKEHIYLFPFEINPQQLNLVKSLTALTDQARFKNVELTGKYKTIVIFVHGMEKLNQTDRKKFFQLLNFFRDRFTMIAHPIVLWAKPAFVRQMARSAPDFWSWKGDLFCFPADTFEIAASKKIWPGKTPLLQQYLNALLADPDYVVWNDLYLPLNAVRAAETLRLSSSRHTFSDEEIAQLTGIFHQTSTIKAKQIVLKQGEPGKKCYVLLQGEVNVAITDALGNEVVVSRLKRGDFFGEIALIKNIPRTATVKTVTDCKVIVLTKPQLRAAASKIANLLSLMADTAERRFEAIARIAPGEISPLRRFANQRSLTRPVPRDIVDLIRNDKRVVILGGAEPAKQLCCATSLWNWRGSRTAISWHKTLSHFPSTLN